MKLYHILLAVLFSAPVPDACGQGPATTDTETNTVIMNKVNIGNKLALYPTPVTVVGADVGGSVNWLVVSHVGIIGHDHILVSMSDRHHTNQGILESKKLSVNIVDRKMLPKADYVGSVSGAQIDKSGVFSWQRGENGSPVIDEAPLTMELDVVDVYKSEGFDNFICTIANTYASPEILDSDGNIDYNVLKPVLFEFPTYSYLATGEIIGLCRRFEDAPSMCHKQPMQPDGIIRLSKIEVYPEYRDEYLRYATEVGDVSLRTEPGVLTMYAVAEKENPCNITILETYASEAAYKSHIASPHFREYKQGTLHMVKSLVLSDQDALNPDNEIRNYIKL